MIEHGPNMSLYCDGAGCSEAELFIGSWQECLDEAKESGWIIVKIDDDYQHFCSPECADKRPREAEGRKGF
jgi:hypothetical protein